MKSYIYLPLHVSFLLLSGVIFNNTLYAQEKLYPLSFKANQGHYQDNYAEYYYKVQKGENGYKLVDAKNRTIFQSAFDTIVKNAFYIKTVAKSVITVYDIQTLKKIALPDAKQVYFVRDGLEVLSTQGAQYYDHDIKKINSFPPLDIFTCGTVYSEQYTLQHNEKTKKYSVDLSEGDLGALRDETSLEFEGLPDDVESICFLNGKKYISKSINNQYDNYPHLLKVIKEGKSGIYSFDLDQAIYPVKEKKVVHKKPEYTIDIITGDTIFMEVPDIEIEPISFIKEGKVKLQEVLPIAYSNIYQSANDGLVYIYKNKQIGIYPQHTSTGFSFFKQKTISFYKIIKNGKHGWLDIRTFKEYYFN